jgi:hypothetical protein
MKACDSQVYDVRISAETKIFWNFLCAEEIIEWVARRGENGIRRNNQVSGTPGEILT